jgi:hypothetical protein
LVVLAHPDDPEYFCGATVARWAAEGMDVTYCLVTSGDKGADVAEVDPQELALRREDEQRAAAEVLGVREVIFLRREDGALAPDLDLRRDIVRVIRRTTPGIVITCDPTTIFPRRLHINHADHRAVGLATIDAVIGRRFGVVLPELLGRPGSRKVRQVYIAGSQTEHGGRVTDSSIASWRCAAIGLKLLTSRTGPRVRERMRSGSPAGGRVTSAFLETRTVRLNPPTRLPDARARSRPVLV